jgi:hypothetical protein
MSPADILLNAPQIGVLWALYLPAGALGLVPGDNMDALDASVRPAAGTFPPPAPGERFYFSLAPGSPTLALIPATAGDILYYDIGSGAALPTIWSRRDLHGLDADDNLDALDIWDPGYPLEDDGGFLEQHLGHWCGNQVPGATQNSAPVARANAVADVPSPANSSVSPCLVSCPAGDVEFEVIVRDVSNNPRSGSVVTLDFSACVNFSPCPGTDPYVVDQATRTITMATNAAGRAVFPLRLGGTCPAGAVRVRADGVLLATRALASPDQDGSLLVNGLDRDLLIAKGGSTDPTGDFDCDGTVNGVLVLDVPPPIASRSFSARLGPNPLAPGRSAHLIVQVPTAGRLDIELFDVMGRRVDRQSTDLLASGTWRLQWQAPSGLASGVYSLRIGGGPGLATLKVAILEP